MSNEYGASNIKVLKGLEAVRKRPGMYIGSTDERGLHHCVYEVVDNSIDEAMAGHCDTINVTITKNNTVIVSDNGRGIPTDEHPVEKISAATVVLTVLHAGGKFDKDTYKVSGGLHGVGVSVVNALSSELKMTIYRNNEIHYQEFSCGIPKSTLEVIGTTKKTGTTIEFLPDTSIFETDNFSFEILAKRFREVAYLNPKITIILNDKRDGKKETYHFEGGISQFVTDLNKSEAIIEKPISFSIVEEGVEADIALLYNNTYIEKIQSFVNNIRTIDGGTHESGFKAGLTKSIVKYAKENKKKNDKDIKITGDDVREGLIVVVSVKVPEPQFEGQTKSKLGSSYVKPICQKITYENLNRYFEENPKQARLVIEKIIEASSLRERLKKARDSARNKTLGPPGKLAPISSETKPEDAELFLVEGDSAGGSAKQARDRKKQAILPLKGKILNVEKSKKDKIMTSDEVKNIIAVLKCGIHIDGTFDEEKVRYHKIIIMTDADVDGSHIQTLLLTFFYRHYKPLIDKGYLYIAQPPLYRYKKGKNEIYLKDDTALSTYLIENGLEQDKYKFESLEYDELLDIFKIVSLYRSMLQNLEKRYSLIGVLKHLIENNNLISLPYSELFNEIKQYLNMKKYNILSQLVTEEKIHIFVQTNEGLEELLLDDELFNSPFFKEAISLFKKLHERDLSVFKGEDLVDVLEAIETESKKGAYIQRYKGLGEMNPEQLWKTTMKEENRRLLQVRISDAEVASDTFSLFMGDEVEPRRKYIEDHAKDVEHLDV
jgi:DNA gyrase subunit B